MSEAHRRDWSLSTRTVHHPDVIADSPPLAPPLYQSSTFRADRAATIADYARQTKPGAFYTRWGNPTVEAWEKLMAELEGGQSCLAFASGMAAVSTTLFALLSQGDHVVAGSSLYTATTKLLTEDLPAWGVETTLVDPIDPQTFDRAARGNTRMFYIESPANPTMGLTDIPAVASIARARGALTVVDNTFASTYNQKPLSAGADVVLHSATKYLSGHSDVVAGCAIADRDTCERIWQQRTLLGGSLDPFAAWLLLRGMKTFALRMERHNHNALALAQWLEKQAEVARVMYPGLNSHPQHELAARQMLGYGGMVSFELRGGKEAGTRFVESTRLAVLAVSLGGAETLVEHPASMSHAVLSEEALHQAGIPAGLVRLSVGIEDPADLIADMAQALAKF